MGIDKMVERNISRNLRPEDIGGLIAPTGDQTAITEKWILPYKETILADTRALRKEVDRTLQKDPELRKRLHAGNLRYPKGLCPEITDAVFNRLSAEMLNSSKPGMQILKNFVREGGLLRPFFGIDSNTHFQNAIQIGDSILDVAHDTAILGRNPVTFYPKLRDAPIKAIETVEQFADIAEKQWKFDVYPNIYLPQLAPVFPVLVIEPRFENSQRKDVLRLEENISALISKNLHTLEDGHLFGLSSHFLFRSAYREKRLPPQMIQSLLSPDGPLSAFQNIQPNPFRLTTDPEEVRWEMAHYHAVESDLDMRVKKNRDHMRARAMETAPILEAGQSLAHVILASVRR